MTRRWRYQIHTKGVGKGSLESDGSVDTVEEIIQIAKANPDKKIVIHAPLDERREETEALIGLGVEREFP
jgi:copper homeostasis protein CutC